MTTQNSIADQIQPSVLTRLAAYAQRTGRTINDVLQEMIDEREADMQLEEQSLLVNMTSGEWARELRAWAARHPTRTVAADDSREGIYVGRGE